MENLSLSLTGKECPLAVLFASRQDDSECAFTKDSILKHYQISLSDANSITSFGVQFNALQIFPTVSTVTIFIPGHFGNNIVADARSFFKVFLFHVPVYQQFPELFIAYIHTVSLDSNRIYWENRNSRSWLFRI